MIISFFIAPFFAHGAEGSHFDTDKILLSSNSSSVTQKIAVDYPPKFDKSNPQARGVVLTFHNWPNAEKKNLITKHFGNAGLIKKKEIKRFKVWVFEWPEWNKAKKARQLCKSLLSVSSFESCEPDYLVETAIYNYVPSASDAREMIGKTRSALEKAEQRVENAREAFNSRKEKADRISQQMATDKGLITEKKRLRTAKFALKQAKKELERATGDDKIKRARERVKRLEKLVEGRRKRVENRKKWFKGTKEYVENNQNRLVESRRINLQKAEKWLKATKHSLKERVSKYAKYLPPQEAEALSRYVQSLFPQEEPVVGGGGENPPDDNEPVVSDSQQLEDVAQQNGNISTCSIASSQFRLLENQLSDYWAQEMVGSDLLKEEIKKATPVQKHLVEVFDIPPGHDVGVRNLISDEGEHSVLPEIGDKAGITHTPTNSSALVAADKLLTKAEKKCAAHQGSSDSNAVSHSGSVNQGGGGSHQADSSGSNSPKRQPKRKTASHQGSSGSNPILHSGSTNQEKTSKLKTVNQGTTNVNTVTEIQIPSHPNIDQYFKDRWLNLENSSFNREQIEGKIKPTIMKIINKDFDKTISWASTLNDLSESEKKEIIDTRKMMLKRANAMNLDNRIPNYEPTDEEAERRQTLTKGEKSRIMRIRQGIGMKSLFGRLVFNWNLRDMHSAEDGRGVATSLYNWWVEALK